MITMKINYRTDVWITNYTLIKDIEKFLYDNNLRFGYDECRNALPTELYLENDETASWIKMKFDV